MVERDAPSDIGAAAGSPAEVPARRSMLDGDTARRIVESAMEKVLERAAADEGREVRTPAPGANFEARLSAVENRLGQVETRLAVVETKLVTVIEATTRVEARLERFDAATAGSFKDVRDHARADFRLLFGALIAVALGLAGMMAKGFHWL